MTSGDFCELAKETQKDYRKYAAKVLSVFGKMNPCKGVKQFKESARTRYIKNGMISVYVLHQVSGSKYTRDNFNAHWMKAKKAATERYPELRFDFTFHDLKAKGISDLEGSLYDKQTISGHKNVTQTARYDRKIAVVPVVGGQNMAK